MRILACGDRTLLVELAESPSVTLTRRLVSLKRALASRLPQAVQEAIPAFASLTVFFDPERIDAGALAAEIAACLEAAAPDETPAAEWELPVCYGGDCGPDLAEVAERCGLAPQEVVRRHAAVRYTVYMLGFSPGFPYLGDTDPSLALPRRSDPRTRVPAGSVSIATRYSAIYSVESPGGWHILGRTPVKLFDPAHTEPSLLRAADSVRFVPIARDEFDRIGAQVAAGTYVPRRSEPAP